MSRSASTSFVSSSSGSTGRSLALEFRCAERNPTFKRWWSSQLDQTTPAGSLRSGSISSASDTVSAVSEEGDGDACINRRLWYDPAREKVFLEVREAAKWSDTEPNRARIELGIREPEFAGVCPQEWFKRAVRQAMPLGHGKDGILVAKHHQHLHKTGANKQSDPVVRETTSRTLFFAPDAGRAGKDGLNLHEIKIKDYVGPNAQAESYDPFRGVRDHQDEDASSATVGDAGRGRYRGKHPRGSRTSWRLQSQLSFSGPSLSLSFPTRQLSFEVQREQQGTQQKQLHLLHATGCLTNSCRGSPLAGE